MVVALGPGKFYGSSLPRPRIYTDVQLNEERVDPPVPVLDPLMSWALESHWSMGGLSFQRHRLQGRIEGNVKKLRAEREKIFKKHQKRQSTQASISINRRTSEDEPKTPVAPPAPVAVKRRRFVGLEEPSSEEEVEREVKRTARKLGDDFDRVANDKSNDLVAVRTRSQGTEEKEMVSEKGKKLKRTSSRNAGGEPVAAKGTRSSPRLMKSG